MIIDTVGDVLIGPIALLHTLCEQKSK